MLWDTAGQEEFDAITKAYYRGAQACVLTFSTTDRFSFEAVKDWKKKVENECGEIPTVLVQNKIDLMDQAVVSLWVDLNVVEPSNFKLWTFSEESEALARNLGVRLFRTSVKEDLNVAGVFRFLATTCHELIKQQYNTVLPLSSPTISQFSPTFHSKSNGTIILTRPLKKSSKKKNMLKKCGIIWVWRKIVKNLWK